MLKSESNKMKNSRSEFSANLGLETMQFHKQYKLTPAKISKPKNKFVATVKLLIRALFVCQCWRDGCAFNF